MAVGSKLLASTPASMLTQDNVTPQLGQNSLANIAASNSARTAELNEIKRLRSTNPLYEEYKPDWDFYLASYEGGKDFANGSNINKHPRENPEDFEERVHRIHYLNYCEPLVDFFTTFIFAETIQRDGGANADFYQKFIKDVNKKGEDVTTVMEQVSDAMQIFGMSYVMVDAPKLSEVAVTKAQQDSLGISPYWVVINPMEVLDWAVDSFDKYQYLKRCQVVNNFSLESRSIRTIERYYEWLPDEVHITDVDITDTGHPFISARDLVPNSIGEVPVVVLRYKRSIKNKYMGNSFLRDIAPNNKEVMNLTSLLQEFLYRQCFNILAIEMDSSIPTASQTDGEIGTANVLQHPKGTAAPEYIAPSSDPAKFIQEERANLITQMYKRAAQDTVNELFNGGAASGFSKAQSFSTTVPKIATRADSLEKAENRLMELTMKFMNKTWDGKIKYKDRYELTNISDALSQLTTLFKDLQMPSETFIKEEMKRFVHEFDGKLTDEAMVKIYKEIDGMDFEAWQEIQKEALVGLPKIPAGGSGSPDPAQQAKENQASNDAKQKAPSAKVKKTKKPSTTKELTAESKKGN